MALIDFELDGELQCELDGSPFTIHARGSRILIRLPDRRTALKLMRMRIAGSTFRGSAERLKNVLDSFRCRLEIDLGQRQLLVMGYQTGSPLWRLFGLPSMSFKPLAMLARTAERRAPAR